MKTKLISLLLIVLMLLPAPFAAADQKDAANVEPALSFSTETLSGDPIDSSILRNYDLVLVSFWNEFDHELSAMQQLHTAYDNLLILGVYDGYNPDTGCEKGEDYGVTFPLIPIAGTLEYYSENMGSYFSYFFFDKNGKRIGSSYYGILGYDYWVTQIDAMLESPAHMAELSFESKTLDGNPIDSSIIEDYDLIVVNFWAEWCGPCVGEMPSMQQIYEEYDNVLFIGAYIGYGPASAKAKLKELGVTYPCILLEGTLEDYATRFRSIPATYFFNACGEEIGFPEIGSTSYDGWKEMVEKNLALSRVKPKITTQPKNASVAAGKIAKFKTNAKGRSLTYQWFYRTSPTGSWKRMTNSSSKKPTLTMTAKESKNGWQFRCRIKSANGLKAYTKAATLTVGKVPKITLQPLDKTVKSGAKVKLKTAAEGTGLTYQWYYRTSAKAKWKKASGATKATYTVTVKKSGYQYRCKVTNPFGSVYSQPAVLKIKK